MCGGEGKSELVSTVLCLLAPFTFVTGPLLFIMYIATRLILRALRNCHFSRLFIILLLGKFICSDISFTNLQFCS